MEIGAGFSLEPIDCITYIKTAFNNILLIEFTPSLVHFGRDLLDFLVVLSDFPFVSPITSSNASLSSSAVRIHCPLQGRQSFLGHNHYLA